VNGFFGHKMGGFSSRRAEEIFKEFFSHEKEETKENKKSSSQGENISRYKKKIMFILNMSKWKKSRKFSF